MRRDGAAAASIAPVAGGFQLPLMFVVVAVHAQEFPVASIRRVVVVIVIAVMDCEFAKVGSGAFARAATTDPWIKLERLLPLALFALYGSTASVRHDAVQFVGVCPMQAVISFEETVRAPATVEIELSAPDRRP